MSQSKQQLGYEAVLKALKAHSNTIPGLSEEELDAGFQAFKRETDRGAVILIATTVEDKLTERFHDEMSHLNSDERARLFGWDGPLGTFSAKLRLGHALQYYDRQTFKLGEVVREMRNACAHSRQDISFGDPALRDAVLLMAKMIGADFEPERDPSTIRMFYLIAVTWLIQRVVAGVSEATFEQFLEAAITAFEKQSKTSVKRLPARSSPSNPENQTGS